MKTATRATKYSARPFVAKIVLTTAVAAILCAWIAPSTALGFGSWSQETDPTGYTHFNNNPNDFPSWDKTNITYKIDASFTATWPNPLVSGQIREAFNQWDWASWTAPGSQYSYNRANGWQNFGDIRSVAVHELGHVLGIRHPNQAAAVSRNWRPGGGGLVQQADQGNEVMRSWINPGDYNHVLSHDELDAFNRLYSADISFSEVFGATPADVTISSYTAGVNNWALGGWSGNWRNAGDHSQGIRITSGQIQFNDSSGQPLGFKTLGINWDYQNVGGKPTRGFQIRTNGTNSNNPLFHFDNQWPAAGNRFTTFNTVGAGSNAKDDRVHTWGNSLAGDIPDSELIHVGLEQDVWDWNVVSAQVLHPDGTKTNAPLLSFHDWSNTIVVGTPAAADDQHGNEEELTTALLTRVRARGIRLAAPDVASVVTNISVGLADGLNLRLEDLNRELVDRLRKLKRFETLDLSPITLGPGGDFFLILEGTPNDIPGEILEQGNFVLLNRPDLLDQELVLVAQSQSEQAVVGTFALLGVPPNTRVPEPATLSLLALGGAVLVRIRRRRA